MVRHGCREEVAAQAHAGAPQPLRARRGRDQNHAALPPGSLAGRPAGGLPAPAQRIHPRGARPRCAASRTRRSAPAPRACPARRAAHLVRQLGQAAIVAGRRSGEHAQRAHRVRQEPRLFQAQPHGGGRGSDGRGRRSAARLLTGGVGAGARTARRPPAAPRLRPRSGAADRRRARPHARLCRGAGRAGSACPVAAGLRARGGRCSAARAPRCRVTCCARSAIAGRRAAGTPRPRNRQRSAARGLRPRRGRPCRARGGAAQRLPAASVRGGRCGARPRPRVARPQLVCGRCCRHCSALRRRCRQAAGAFSRIPVRLAPALSRGPAALARRVAQRRSCGVAAAGGARRALHRRRARLRCLTQQGVGSCRSGLAGSGAAPRGRPLGWRRLVPERQTPQRRSERSGRLRRRAGAGPAAGRGRRRALAGARPRGWRRRRHRRGARQASSLQLRRGGAPGLGQAEARAVQQAANSRACQHPHARALQQAGQRRPGRQRRQRLARSASPVGQRSRAPHSAPHAGSV